VLGRLGKRNTSEELSIYQCNTGDMLMIFGGYGNTDLINFMNFIT
jgi:hypothetical protein